MEEVGTQRHLEHHFAVTDTVKEIISPQMINSMFEQDFTDHKFNAQDLAYSHEDKMFLKKVSEGGRRVDGHYEIPLPFKSESPSMPDNRQEIVKRAIWLKRRFLRDRKIYDDYCDFMKEIIDKGYARKITEDNDVPEIGKVWYLPHHGVYHPRKPGKIRVVFHCSASFQGTSLNDQ